MWKIKEIEAKNICSFESLNYTPTSGKTTLVFGKNLDNESQGSNGSGKSALIEIFAIGLTGDVLRKVNFEDVINDSAEEAEIKVTLINDSSNDVFQIDRKICRNSPQQVIISLNGESISEPSVSGYNTRIFSILGVNKDDIFSTFVLSKHRYSPFLMASDRVKKELINRFSNGHMVDCSLDLLTNDIEGQKDKVNESEKAVALITGKISATEDQIGILKQEQLEKSNRREEIIAAHQESIAKYQKRIRESNELIIASQEAIDKMAELDVKIQDTEQTENSLKVACEVVNDLLAKNGLPTVRDYSEVEIKSIERIEKSKELIRCINEELIECDSEIERMQIYSAELKEELELEEYNSEPIKKQLDSELKEAEQKLAEIDKRQRRLRSEYDKLNQQLSYVRNKLAGAIECPNCKHKFILESKNTVQELEIQKAQFESEMDALKAEGENNRSEKEALHLSIESGQDEIRSLQNKLNNMQKEVNQQHSKLLNAQRKQSEIKLELGQEKGRLSQLEEAIVKARTCLFDDAFAIIDKVTSDSKKTINNCEVECETWKGNIESYKEAIEQAKNVISDHTIVTLQEKSEAYKKDQSDAQDMLHKERAELDKLLSQQARFLDFKTYLANTKIIALSQMTNMFLESIGSDLRIAMSGYTPLKSGKVREKISISVIRDGIDCGAFAKLSQGEQCRINLASILAIHKLTNMDCEDGKGLDLLVLDEILDATDESGLSHMFNALNKLQITSMIVTHGQTAENYPHKLLVIKQNGISTIE